MESIAAPGFIAEVLQDHFARSPGDLVCVYLFGSVARGEARPDSDVDVAVLFDAKAPGRAPVDPLRGLHLAAELDGLLGKDVDVIDLETAPVDLIHRILRDGMLVLDRDPLARARFEVAARNHYFDLKPILEEYRRVREVVPMVDRDLVRKKLAFIESCAHELRTIARPERIETDVREERFIAHTLLLAIQAALDIASHVVSDERLGEPRTNRGLFELLEQANWVDASLATHLRAMAGFRNVVVHGYDVVDPAIMRDIVQHRLDDLIAYVATIRSSMSRPFAIIVMTPPHDIPSALPHHVGVQAQSLCRRSPRHPPRGPSPGSSCACLPNRFGGGSELVVVVIEKILRDLPPGREPHLVMAGDVGKRLFERLHPIG